MNTKPPNTAKLAPNSRVPVLELDDGTGLLESMAICRYFEALYPEPPLFGTDPLSQGRIEMWSRRIEMELMLPMAGAFRHTHPAMAQLERQVQEYGAISRENSERRLQVLDRDLAESTFVVGEVFSAADITLLCTLDFFGNVGKYEFGDNVKRWHAVVSARPSASA